jgi:lysophospholipid acyltransferase (LPLAT)-like uncharacterized protein
MYKNLSKFALRYGLIPFAGFIIRLYFSTIRLKFANEEMVREHIKMGGKVIAALWHQRIFTVIDYARRFSDYEPSAMVSQSRDGDMAADLFKRFQFRPVRGSSSRGGKEALQAMVDDLRDHSFAVHVTDGPQGPKGVVKSGLIRLAQLSQVPIFPAYISASRAWILNSWDCTLIPKPFSEVFVRWGNPIYVPADLDNQTFESIRLQVEQCMRENQRLDDLKYGWQDLI